MFIYNKENLKKIENPNDVNCLCSHRLEKGSSVFAHLVGGESIMLTKPMGVMTYHFEPLYHITREVLGFFYSNNFYKITDDCAVNESNFVGFNYEPSENGKFMDIIANFKDGTSCNLYGIRNKYFEKEKARLDNIVKEISELDSDHKDEMGN
jgi:hypothetical protein